MLAVQLSTLSGCCCSDHGLQDSRSLWKRLASSDKVSNTPDADGCTSPPGQDKGVQDCSGVVCGEGGDHAIHDDAEGDGADEKEHAK